MKARTRIKKGERVGDWEIISDQPWKGGNSRVWEVKSQAGLEGTYALKLLNEDRFQHPDGKRYQRFRDEIQFVRSRPDPGILPIIDFSLPEKPTIQNRPWYVMPLASSILSIVATDERRLESAVQAIIPVARTLANLHESNCAHRDASRKICWYTKGSRS